MKDVESWLAALGLERYGEVFRENEITLAALPHLTEEDLKSIGVALGARRTILAAAAELRAPAAAPPPSAPQPDAASHRPLDAERRQLTVMFCDLVGSTALSRQLDPEDYRDLIRAYQDAVAGATTRYDGHIAKYMGDGVLAYFGFPNAHEDEGERAARAALDIVAAIARMAAGSPSVLAVRIGVATGLVVVGDIVGEAGAQEEAVVGDTPNLAARLQALAEPGQILFADVSRQLCRERFDFADLGDRELKGFETLERVWRLEGEHTEVSRFQTSQPSLQTAFVGREDELAILSRRWDEARAGAGRIVLISGEPGIGKSRLLETWCEDHADDGMLRLRYQCSPFHESSAYYPFVRQLTDASGVLPGQDAATSLTKIAALLSGGEGSSPKQVAAVATIMSVPLEGEYAAAAPSPQEFKSVLFDALFEQLMALCRTQPAVLLFEDLHWIDRPSLELLDDALRRLEALRVLVLLTYRPDFEAPWLGEANVTSLTLNRLNAELTGALSASLSAEYRLAAPLMREIVERSDGIPLFAEELTRSLIDAHAEGAEASHIPATLHDILAARLDRTGQARETAQVGAVIGREFPHDLLLASGLIPEGRLPGDLAALQSAGLITARGEGLEATYSFRHALIQDTAYDSLLRRRRREIHRRIADTLVERFAERARQSPQLLAQHYEAGGASVLAAAQWFDVGKRAAQVGATLEAIEHLRHAVELIDASDDAREHMALSIDCHLALGTATIYANGPADPELLAIYAKASDLCEASGDNQRGFKVAWNQWHVQHFGAQNLDAAVEAAERLLEIGTRQNDHALLLQAHHSAWTSRWSKEDLKATLEHAEAGIRLYDIRLHGSQYDEYGGHDAGACCRMVGGMVHGIMGRLDTARAWSAEALDIVRELDHMPSELMTRGFTTTILWLCRELEPIVSWVDDLERFVAGKGSRQFNLFITTPHMIVGWARIAAGQQDGAMALMESSFEALKQSGFPKIGFQMMLLADAKRMTGDPDEALDLLRQAEENCARMNERIWSAEIARTRANVLVALKRHGDAERSFRTALETARHQEAHLFELRAANDLASLWLEQGRQDEARGLLQPVYERIEEGHDTPDLLAARRLLDELV